VCVCVYVCMCVCASVCVCEREREREIAMREWEGMRACGLFCSQGDKKIMQKRKKSDRGKQILFEKKAKKNSSKSERMIETNLWLRSIGSLA